MSATSSPSSGLATSPLADAEQLNVVHHADQRRPQRDHKKYRDNEDDNGKYHLDPGFTDGRLRPQSPPRAESVGVDFQRLREAGAEALALDDHRGQRLQIVDFSAPNTLLKRE